MSRSIRPRRAVIRPAARVGGRLFTGMRAKKLGLRLLPTLADRDPLFVEGPNLALLKYEVEVLKGDYLREYAERKGRQGVVTVDDRYTEPELYVVSILDNILAAVQFALDNHALYGVYIG